MAEPIPIPPVIAPLTIAANAAGDQPTTEDSLGFSSYVNAISAFLISDATQPPLTMSIEGEWGSGKSSFMLQLEKAIRGPSKRDVLIEKLPRGLGGLSERASLWNAFRSASTQRQQITIQFNAWRHDKQDALWAAFALTFTKSLRKQVGHFRAWKGDFSLFRQRLSGLRGWTELGLLIVSLLCLAVGIAGLCRFVNAHSAAEIREVIYNLTTDPHKSSASTNKKEEGKQLNSPYDLLLSHGKLGAFLLLAGLGFIKFKQLKVPLSINLEKYLSKPDYRGHVAFIEGFHEDFSRLINAYAKDRRIFVFIDDLDRCDVPKAAELMQAINLMIGDAGKLVFILGMDREKVAAGITQKYKELLPYIPSLALTDSGSAGKSAGLYFGYAYLEKFIQLSFTLPVISDSQQLMRFLGSISNRTTRNTWFATLAGFWSTKIGARSRKGSRANAVPTPGLEETSTVQAAVSNSSVAATTREKEIKYLRVRVEKDSDRILQIVAMVSPIFENNPRRLKQFINTLRLSLYLASSQGLFDQQEGVSRISPEQLGKFIAITLRFPDMRPALSSGLTLLEDLEAAAQAKKLSDIPLSLRNWLAPAGVKEILLYGVELGEKPFDREIYSLKEFPVKKLLSILPDVPEKSEQIAHPGSMSGYAHGTSTASATLGFSVDAEVIRQDRSSEAESRTTQGIVSNSSANIEEIESERIEAEVNESEENESSMFTPSPARGRSDGGHGDDWQRVHSQLASLDTDLRDAYREALRILLRDGAASERFTLKELQRRKLATNMAGIFSQMQASTNLVQLIPGQPERGRPEDREWQIRPALIESVRSYLGRHDSSPPLG